MGECSSSGKLAVELLQGDGAQEIVVPLIAHVLLAAASHHHIVAHIMYKLDDPSLGTSPLPDARFLIQHPLIVVEHLLVGTGSQFIISFSESISSSSESTGFSLERATSCCFFLSLLFVIIIIYYVTLVP